MTTTEIHPAVGELLDPDELGFWMKSVGRLARNIDRLPHDHPTSIERRLHIKAGGAVDRFRKDLTRGEELPLTVDWMTGSPTKCFTCRGNTHDGSTRQGAMTKNTDWLTSQLKPPTIAEQVELRSWLKDRRAIRKWLT